ncbi:MAG: winged helix-turn-helix transcriptional regulator [Theionarchaea archaeon]|nr:MAG: hypothetical protein AYK19_00035 [Theionarchaea archaeon DG-70-1]MBU7030722.1 winged helix-turn-helix transcriptional regulator [Theionarchaea archaeon]
MDKKEEKEFLKLIGLTGTIFILRYLNEHDSGQYKDLQDYINTHSLNQRLRTLLHFNLVEHHYVRDEKKKEWYTLTEKGRKILILVEKMIKTVE